MIECAKHLMFLNGFRDFNNMAVLQSDQKMDYKVALEMTSEFLILELIHRVIVCFYEVSN